MTFSADLIDDRLWLGSIAAANDSSSLKQLDITHVLTIVNFDVEINDKTIVHKHIRLEDIETSDLLTEFDSCYEFIDNALAANPKNNVLIHCQAGVSRSATIACLWLMRRHRLSGKEALERLRTARPCVSPNEGFAAQLYLFERMNHQFDRHHTLYKEFQFEVARQIYLNHDVENDGLDNKHQLRQKYRQAFTPPFGHADWTTTEQYLCKKCQTKLFTNADLLKHPEGRGQFDWCRRYNRYLSVDLSLSEPECHQSLFTYPLEWLMDQIDTPTNDHGGPILCPKCRSIVGDFHLNGGKCLCGKWIVPSFHFQSNQVEEQRITEITVETSKSTNL